MQKGIQTAELRLPELAVVLKPLGGVAEGTGFQSPRTPLRILSARNQSCPFEYFQVFGNRRLAHRKRPRRVRYWASPLAWPGGEGGAGGIGQRREGRVKAS